MELAHDTADANRWGATTDSVPQDTAGKEPSVPVAAPGQTILEPSVPVAAPGKTTLEPSVPVAAPGQTILEPSVPVAVPGQTTLVQGQESVPLLQPLALGGFRVAPTQPQRSYVRTPRLWGTSPQQQVPQQ